MILTSLDVDPARLRDETGWDIKPPGACRGEMCVPLGPEPVTAQGLSERLRMPLVADEKHRVWALGPSVLSSRALDSAEMPDVVLPDHTGASFRLSSLRGQKVFLLAWASW